MISIHRNIFGVDGGIHTKIGGKTYALCAFDAVFPPFLEWIPPSTHKILR